ncbi:MAG: transcription elongation factor GreA [Acidiferrobacteraceae bacterium]
MNKVPLTVAGVEKLRKELHRLKTVERPRIIQAIAEARAHGDLSENAEYHAAKEQQSFTEGRIADLEAKLSNAQIIDPLTVNANGKVVFGATLDLLDEDSQQEVTYQIVGDEEADISEGKISISSPIARALIGKETGELVEVRVPDGVRQYEILGIRYV